MKTKNAARITPAESAHMAAVKALACVICGAAGGCEAHLRGVPGFPHTYASPHGEIYSDHPGNRWKGKLIKLSAADNGRGYLRVKCHGKMRCIHRLIALAFLGPIAQGLEVNHVDANKLNNCPENLEYTTRSGNMQHASRCGLRRDRKGESHSRAKLSNDRVSALRRDYAALISDGRPPLGAVAALAARYGVRNDYPRDVFMGRARIIC